MPRRWWREIRILSISGFTSRALAHALSTSNLEVGQHDRLFIEQHERRRRQTYGDISGLFTFGYGKHW